MASNIDNLCRNNPHIIDGQIDKTYLVLDYIGGGGMACVYKVRTADDPTPYAIKLLQDQYFNDKWVLRSFKEEATHMLNLNHPNIVRFYEAVTRYDIAYIRMDYIKGKSLLHYVREFRDHGRQFPLNEVIRILVQAARGLDFLHKNDIIHRDIKAANILIEEPSGKVFLTDFGIATDTRTVVSFNAGTRAYMPPEQQENTDTPVTSQSDLYAFAIVAYEMLTGVRPFRPEQGLRGEQAEDDLIRKHRDLPIPPLAEQGRTDLRAGLDTIFQKALAKNPDHRYVTAYAFVEDLHRELLPDLTEDMQVLSEIGPLDLDKLVAIMLMRQGGVPTPSAPLQPVVAGSSSFTEKTDQPVTAPNIPRQSGFPTAMVVGISVILVIIVGIMLALASRGTPTETAAIQATDTPAVLMVVTDLSPTIPPTQIVATETPTALPPSATPVPSETATEIQTSTSTDTPTLQPSDTPVPSATASPTATTTATLTNTPSAAAQLVNVPSMTLLQDSVAFGLSGELNESFEIAFGESAYTANPALIPLDVGPVNGFRVEWTLTEPLAGIVRYGVAYRVADDENFLLFTLHPTTREWTIEEARGASRTTLNHGQLEGDDALSKLTVTGLNENFLFRTGAHSIEDVNSARQEGGLGLWLETDASVVPAISALKIGLVGDALEANPTPAKVTGLLNYLADDVTAMLATGNLAATTIECGDYMPIFERLNRHVGRGGRVADFANRAISAGQLIYNLCDLEGSRAILTVPLSDLQKWNSELKILAMDIKNAR